MADNRIIRTKSHIVRAAQSEDGSHVVEGLIPYGALSVETRLGYSDCSREKLEAGCFADWIAKNDVYANYAHDSTLVLGNTKSGTLTLDDKADGLHFSLTLGESDVATRCYDTIKRGDCDTLSFEFYPREWTEKDGVTTLKRADLFAISLCVINPAYTDTQSQTIRSKRSTMDEQKLDDLKASIDKLVEGMAALTELVKAQSTTAEEERDDEEEKSEIEAKEKELEELEKELEEELKEEERDGEEEKKDGEKAE